VTAQPGWRRLTLEVSSGQVEGASALLSSASSQAVVLEQRPGSSRVTVSAYVSEARRAEVARRLRIGIALLRDAGVLAGESRVRQTRVAERDWSNAWKRYLHPFTLARRMYVVPSWERRFRLPRGAESIRLDPGMAFGTGRHATTRMAAALLLERLEPRDVVIDAGCGSGILSLAATLRGARAYAFDDDAVAVRVARDNFNANARRPAALVVADRVPPNFPKAAVIVANITATALTSLASQFARKLVRRGSLISSGITARGRLSTLAAFENAGLAFVSERRSGEWFAYVHVKR
jgi:ribosomal protein L11 methyltransferase